LDETKISSYPKLETPHRGVSTKIPIHIKTPKTDEYAKTKNWKPGVLGAIIGQYKMVAAKQIRIAGNGDFAWQPRFHDHIIRNDRELFAIRRYIQNNPAQWDTDDVPEELESFRSQQKPWYVYLA